MYNKAFTLIEITIALLILAIGIVGILTLFPVGFDASGRAANIIEATFLAQGLIEDAKRVGYNYITAKNEVDIDIHPKYGYDLLVSNIDYDSDGVTDLREVVVRVYWPKADGTPGARTNQKYVELNIYLAQYEM